MQVRKKLDADFIQAAIMQNAHLFIHQKIASFSQNALTVKGAFISTQTANLKPTDPSAQIKVAFSNIKEKERFQPKLIQ